MSETKLTAPETTEAPKRKRKAEPPRGTIAEWTVTILLLLFGTTTLVQAFVIPTGSMEDTLLIGDHLLVDKLAYAPPGPISRSILPYSAVKRGDIIVFRYPIDINQTFVKRVIGVPGDRIRIENKQVYRNGELRAVGPQLGERHVDVRHERTPSVSVRPVIAGCEGSPGCSGS